MLCSYHGFIFFIYDQDIGLVNAIKHFLPPLIILAEEISQDSFGTSFFHYFNHSFT